MIGPYYEPAAHIKKKTLSTLLIGVNNLNLLPHITIVQQAGGIF